MIKEVNLLQNPIEYDKYIEEYLIQALANLGQRMGIKGDGVSYKSFTFNDLINSDKNYSSDKYIGYIKYVKNNNSQQINANFGVCEYNNTTGKTYNEKLISENFDVNNILYFKNDLSFDIPVGSIEKYAKNSICINDGTDLTFMLAGKLIGTDDDDPYNTVIYYYKFDIATNLLKFGVKIGHYNFDNNYENRKDWFYMVKTVNKAYEENGYKNGVLGYDYTMQINVFDASTLKSINETTGIYANEIYAYQHYTNFVKAFTFSEYKNNYDVPYSVLRPKYESIEALLNYEEPESTASPFINNSMIAVILNYMPNSIYAVNGGEQKLNLSFNSNINEFFAYSNTKEGDIFESVVKSFKKNYGLNLSEELKLLSEDSSKLYHSIFKYYNDKYYFENSINLYKRILLKLFEKITNKEYDANLSYTKYKLYIPLNYQFNYICNSNNNMYIYYSSNMYVTFANLNIINKVDFWKNNSNLVYDYDKELTKVKTYNFYVNYNKNDETLINFVDVLDIYTMPYINAAENWSVNDTDTKVHAIGKNAGNPNIIIIFNRNINEENVEPEINNNFYVLNAVYNKSKINEAKYIKRSFYINPVLFDNNTYSAHARCYAYVPEINQNNIEYFKDSIIFSISSLGCIEPDVYQHYFKGSYVLSIWNLKDVSENTTNGYASGYNYQFEYIKDIVDFDAANNEDLKNIEYALSLGPAVNMSNAISDFSIANLDYQDLLLLKASLSALGQENILSNGNHWVIIKNKTGNEYNIYNRIDDNIQIDTYHNNLNAIIQYNDTIELQNDHIVYSHKNNYLNIDNVDITKVNDKEQYIKLRDTTNIIYPKYTTKEEEIIIANKNAVSTLLNSLDSNENYTRITKIIAKDANDNEIEVTNIETYIEELRNNFILHPDEDNYDFKVRIETVEGVIAPPCEYVFNENVPTLDLKEVFIRNANVLNRTNILSIDEAGYIYNAYIGTSYDHTDKSILHIGTDSNNINIGTDTLIDNSLLNKFKTHDKLSLDFKELEFNTEKNIKLKHNNINDVSISTYNNSQAIENNHYYNISLRVIGGLSAELENLINDDMGKTDCDLFINKELKYSYGNNNICTITTGTDFTDYNNLNLCKHILCVNKLIKHYIKDIDLEKISNINIKNVTNIWNGLGDNNFINNIDIYYNGSWNSNKVSELKINDDLYFYKEEITGVGDENYIYLIFNKEKYNNKIYEINNSENTNSNNQVPNILYCDFNLNIMYYFTQSNNNTDLNMYISIN